MNIERNLADLLATGADADMPVPDTDVPMIRDATTRYPVPTPEQVEHFMNSTNITWSEVPADQAPPVAEDETVRLVSPEREAELLARTKSMPAESGGAESDE
ncbi:hypothetical protein [Nocardia vaccinii]|uniref:hypothetical protein n=1 Tax=Nocardia vaccinii TaxID=1822 RepID=UPI00082E6F83|nr:hypothetical protein [Nocardia vaccinii]